jgi:hypothetical protein
MPPISASEAISPALERTKQICFRPFKFGRWLKLAVVTAFTGEVATTSCNFRAPTSASGGSPGPIYTPPPSMGGILGVLHAIPVILLALAFIAAIGVFVLVMSYLWCQFRLTLIDTVLTGECRIRESWEKYGQAGIRLFGFYLLSSMLMVVTAIGLLVLPLMSAARSGVFRQPGGGLAYLLGAGAILLLIFVIVVVLFWIVVVFLKDFVAPVLALEDLTIGEAWGRVKTIASADPGAFVVYILMKIVLAIASGIIFGIVTFVVVLAILIPTIIVAVAVGVTFKGQLQNLSGLFSSMTAAKLALIATAVVVFIAAIAYLLAFISVPAAIFFESYALFFLGSRYEPLRALLIPEPSPAPYPIIPPQAPPDFIPPHPGPETA